MKGFIAITTSLILSLLVLAVVLALSGTALLTRSNNVNFYRKKLSHALARGCLDIALLKLSTDSNYAGNEIITLDSDLQCSILFLEIIGNNKVIKSRAQIDQVVTNLQLTVTPTLSTVSLEEIPRF